ncbi:hypothetical protein B0J14DRAFT_555611 [Halenospora varia]|nr:hypothetical protein B0J14DRAFT_555611 [Halenospora varia]
MDSLSRSRKRGSEDQLDKQIENSEPENTKRSKASLESLLEPVPAGDPNFTGNPLHLAVLSDDRALYVSDYNVDLCEQQNKRRSMMNSQSRQEGEELSGTIAHESIVRQDLQTPVNGNTGQGPVTNYHNPFTVPVSTRQEDRRIAFAGEPDRPVVGMNHNSLYNPVEGGGNHALQDYQMQLMLLDQQNKKRRMMARQEQEGQDTALRTITSLPDQLNIAHASVKELLENLPAYFQNIQNFKHTIPADVRTLQGYEEDLGKKEAKIRALENSYNELFEMTPGAQQGELLEVRDKAMLTMQQEREKLRLNRDNVMREVEGKNERIAELEGALERARELVPELIEDLIKLAPKLRDV